MATVRVMSVRLPYDPRAARTARRLVDELLVAHGADEELRQDAALVVHELVMNSVIHGKPGPDGDIELAWQVVGTHAAAPQTFGLLLAPQIWLVAQPPQVWVLVQPSLMTPHLPAQAAVASLGVQPPLVPAGAQISR